MTLFTTEAPATITVTMTARAALRAALVLLWGAIRHPRSGVTLTVESD